MMLLFNSEHIHSFRVLSIVRRYTVLINFIKIF